MKTKDHVWPVLVALMAMLMPQAQAADGDSLQNPVLKPLYGDMRMLFLRHYPKGSSHLVKDRIHFEYDTRVFILHEPTKTGQWQDPGEERGPNLGGIQCDITLQSGRYQGAALVPQTFDKRYFSVLLMAPYSPKHNAHLIVHLSYPRNVNQAFLKEFMDLLKSFEEQGQ